jgi:hypothetical protein
MPEPKTKLTLDDFKFDWDDDEENLLLTITGEDGQVEITVERELAEELASQMCEFLGLDDAEDDD